jgi:hypothetical protein
LTPLPDRGEVLGERSNRGPGVAREVAHDRGGRPKTIETDSGSRQTRSVRPERTSP